MNIPVKTVHIAPRFKKFICDDATPITLFHHFTNKSDYSFLFESADTTEGYGRYSFIGFDHLELFEFETNGNENPLEILKHAAGRVQFEAQSDLPFFQSGFVGYFSYEVVRHFEKLNLPPGAGIPEGVFFLPKNLLVFDHFENTLTLIAYSPEDFEKLLSMYENFQETVKLANIALGENSGVGAAQNKEYLVQVGAAKEKIKAGEVFQLVLSQKFEADTKLGSLDIYRRLRHISPSPYMYLLHFPQFAIIGSSPETLVKVENNEILVRPIAGTRKRGRNAEEDAELAEDLLNDPKEKAEHMMLVDLGRNDVGRVAIPGTVEVKNLMHVQKFSHVMHIVSDVIGKRDPQKTLFDIFQAAFPAGTLTGAPKVRAMELIAEFEKRPRGIYGGAVGYFGFDGTMDFAIAIRTMLYRNGHVEVGAGAGIVYDSMAIAENVECRNKARAPLLTLQI